MIPKMMFLLKILLFYDKPPLNGQPALNGHLPVPQGYLYGGVTVFLLFYFSNFSNGTYNY